MSRGLVNKSTGERIPSAPGYIVDKVGDLSALHTTAKDKAVSAINEVADAVNAVESALADKTDTDMVAADFNAGTSYTAGNYCVQNGKLYRFKNNHSGAWSASDVEEVKITGELATLKSGLTSLFSFKPTSFPTFPFTPTKNGFIVLVVEDQASNPSGECTVSVVDTYFNKTVAMVAFTPVNQYDHCNSLMFPVIAGHTYTETFNKQTMSNTTWACSYWT